MIVTIVSICGNGKAVNRVNVIMEKNCDFRARGIDAVRMFGCLAIVSWHVYANGEFYLSHTADLVIRSWDYLVYLFMIVSGFGMFAGYYQKFKNGQIDIETFYKKRYQKILPFFACVVALGILMERTYEGVMDGFIELSLVFGFLPNNQLSIIGVAWTLGTIFAFYITFPFFAFLLGNKRRAWYSLIAALIIQFMCNQYYMTEQFVIASYRNRQNILFCAPFFIGGGILFMYREDIERLMRKCGIQIAIICILVTLVYYLTPKKLNGVRWVEYKLLLVYLSWTGLAVGTKSRLFINRLTSYISGISMEIYLSHMIAFRIVEKTGLIAICGKTPLAYVFVIAIVIIVTVAGITILKQMITLISTKYRGIVAEAR